MIGDGMPSCDASVEQRRSTPGLLSHQVRRLAFALATLIWLAAVYFYWREFVPLRTTLIPPPAGLHWRGATSDGLLIRLGRVEGEPGQPATLTGPLELWNPVTRHVERTMLDESDEVIAYRPEDCDFVAVRRDDTLRLVRLADGQDVLSLPAEDAPGNWWASSDGVIAYRFDGSTLTAYRLPDAKPLWSKANVDNFEAHGPDLVLIELGVSPSPRFSDRILMTNSLTGEVDSRYKAEDVWPRFLSRDGKWAISSRGSASTTLISDFRTGRSLWRIAVPFEHVRFSADGSEVVSAHRSDGRVHFSRWNAADGRELTQPRPADAESVSIVPGPDEGFIVTKEVRTSVAPKPLVEGLKRLGVNWSGIIGDPQYACGIHDSETGRRIGFIDSEILRMAYLVPGGVMVNPPAGRTLRFCAFPPRPNWSWLTAWSLGPIAAVWVTQALRRRIRLIRLSRASLPAYNRL
jgi:hypothetical protein